jgi:hypothetical protein
MDTDRVDDVDDRNDVFIYGGRRVEDAFSRYLLPPLPPPAADAKYGKEDERTAAMRHMVNTYLCSFDMYANFILTTADCRLQRKEVRGVRIMLLFCLRYIIYEMSTGSSLDFGFFSIEIEDGGEYNGDESSEFRVQYGSSSGSDSVAV